MSEPTIKKVLGGLTYNPETVREARSNGDMHTLVFNTGETLTYPTQSSRTIEEVFYSLNEKVRYDRTSKPIVKFEAVDFPNEPNPRTYFSISDVMGATFTASKDGRAQVSMEDCEDCTVDLASNKSLLYGDKVNFDGGNNNTAILDCQDEAHDDNEEINKSGTYTRRNGRFIKENL